MSSLKRQTRNPSKRRPLKAILIRKRPLDNHCNIDVPCWAKGTAAAAARPTVDGRTADVAGGGG